MLDCMPSLDRQVDYWSSTGTAKVFTHPLKPSWLARLDPQSRILDYGCGYGRLSGELSQLGFRRVEGVDISPAMIGRAREQWPDLRFSVISEASALDYADETFDAALLFAVLTCIPTDAGQRGLITELRRVLRPGAALYLSDMCLQPDERNRARYEAFAVKHGTYGVFETGDGAVCRHHEPEWLRRLLAGFDLITTRQVEVETMNGHPGQVTQFLAVKA
jgi:SAM-dependent methyltransferase